MAYIVVGYRTSLAKGKFLGVKPCTQCGKFTEQYLSRSWFTIRLFWFLPIFGVPTGRYLHCGNCNSAVKLDRHQWAEIKMNAADMPKKKDYLDAYTKLKQLVVEAQPEDLNVDTIYSRLMSKVDFFDDGRHIRELVSVYLENSHNAVAVANKNAPAEEAPAAAAQPEAPAAVTQPSVADIIGGKATPVYTAPAVGTTPSVPSLSSVPAEQSQKVPEGKTERSSKRFLWLIPAFLLLPVAIIFFVTAAITAFDPSFSHDFIVSLIAFIIFSLPLVLDIIFFVLALKRYKKIK